MQQHRRHKRDGSRTVAEANALFPIGTPVWFRPVLGEPHEELTEIRSEAWALGDGSVVIKVIGIAGGVSTDVGHLRVRS
jgi:hypothetical protein